jgi:hypothetical protein
MFKKTRKAKVKLQTDFLQTEILDLLARLYQSIFGHAPDQDARSWMVDRLEIGQSGLSLVSDLLTAAETQHLDLAKAEAVAAATDHDAALEVLSAVHHRFLGRRPDAAAAGWLRHRLLAGQSELSLVADLMGTPEYADRWRNPLFVPPGHFYSPITNSTEVETALTAAKAVEKQQALLGIDLDRAAMIALWHQIGDLPRQSATVDSRYLPDNPHFSLPDAFVWEGMLRLIKPQRVIEVGSGWSSALLLDTLDSYFDTKVDLVFIEPYPALLRSRLGQSAKEVRIIETGVQVADPALFATLQDGDILFIDSTHIFKTGSDVVHELFEVLPRLNSGVYVHFHDVFWPFEYPASWALDENRSWNELYALRAFLTDNPRWEIVMLNDYLAKTACDEVRAHQPAFNGRLGGSLYLRKR